MKRLIILQLGYETGPAVRDKAFKKFREDVKQFSFISILKEIEPKAEVIIEFPDNKCQEMYDGLRALDIVGVIDSIIPKDDK